MLTSPGFFFKEANLYRLWQCHRDLCNNYGSRFWGFFFFFLFFSGFFFFFFLFFRFFFFFFCFVFFFLFFFGFYYFFFFFIFFVFFFFLLIFFGFFFFLNLVCQLPRHKELLNIKRKRRQHFLLSSECFLPYKRHKLSI